MKSSGHLVLPILRCDQKLRSLHYLYAVTSSDVFTLEQRQRNKLKLSQYTIRTKFYLSTKIQATV